jgi:hypothetical protein
MHTAELMKRVENVVVLHRKAERPSELNNWEAYVMGPDCLVRDAL